MPRLKRSLPTLLFTVLLTVLGLTFSRWAAALDSDRDQPIQIVADLAVRDELAGETRYEGNVVLTQGSLVITADTLSIRHNTDEADKIVATGKPATLVQQPTPDQAPVVSQRTVRAAGTPGAEGTGRVEVVIPPENLRSDASDG